MKHSRKRHIRNSLASLIMAGLGLGFAGTASADLVFLTDSANTGEGFGNVINILSMQKPGGAGTASDVEQGKVAWNGSSNVITSTTSPTTVLTDPNKTATQTFAAVGLSGATAAQNLRLIWDPSEVGSAAGDDTQVNTLILSIYDTLGSVVFTASLAAPVHHSYVVGPGLGVGDFIYGLDLTQQGTLQTALTLAGDFSAFRIGLESNVSFVDDGPDTWLLANANGGVCEPTPANNFCGNPPPPSSTGTIPEPSSSALAFLGLGLIGASFWKRRRGQTL